VAKCFRQLTELIFLNSIQNFIIVSRALLPTWFTLLYRRMKNGVIILDWRRRYRRRPSLTMPKYCSSHQILSRTLWVHWKIRVAAWAYLFLHLEELFYLFTLLFLSRNICHVYGWVINVVIITLFFAWITMITGESYALQIFLFCLWLMAFLQFCRYGVLYCFILFYLSFLCDRQPSFFLGWNVSTRDDHSLKRLHHAGLILSEQTLHFLVHLIF